MQNFRQFEAGPDPFGRTYHVLLKWLQTAIALRHSDTVDVKFILESEGVCEEKTIALSHPVLLELAAKTRREVTDAWCGRLAATHMVHMISTGEDMEKDLATMSPAQMAACAAEIDAEEQQAIRSRG